MVEVAEKIESAGKRRKSPALPIMICVAALIVLYYLFVVLTGALNSTNVVPVTGEKQTLGQNFLTLRMKVQDIDLANRTLKATLLPIPHGNLASTKSAEISRNLRVEIHSGGIHTSVVVYPGKSVIDPSSVSLALERGDAAYPFDNPLVSFQLSVQDDDTGGSTPFDLEIENSARPWNLTSKIGSPANEGSAIITPISLEGARDPLSIGLVGFYVLAIILTTLMAVVTIGGALIKKELEFSNVIWLTATMISFPVLRNAMPGAPPIGTGLDFIVFFPCMCLIALLLVWTGAYLLWRESKVLRARNAAPIRP